MMKKSFIIIVSLVTAFTCMALIIDPASTETIYDENNIFENLTTIVCIASFLLALLLFFIKLRHKSGYSGGRD